MIKKYSDKEVTLRIIGTIVSRYLTTDYYKTIEVNLAKR